MEILQDLLTDPKPLETYSLWGLLTNIQKQYQAEPQGRAGHGLSKRCMRSIRCAGMHECRRSQATEGSARGKGDSRPLVCPKCGHEMPKCHWYRRCTWQHLWPVVRVIAIITDPYEVNKILECLKRNNAPPSDKVVTKVPDPHFLTHQ